ncbi:MAG: hypothetical protein U0166_09455 [Acidobacteriota bacterium]
MDSAPRAPRGIVAIAALSVACGGPAPPRAPLAEKPAGTQTVRLECEVRETRYPGNPLPSGCSRTVELSWGNAPPIALATPDTGVPCREARARADATSGEIEVRSDGTIHRVVASFRGPASGWAALLLIEPEGRWVRVDRGDGAVPAATLAKVPDLDAALDAKLARELVLTGGLPRDDGLWALLADPAIARRHVAPLAALARSCKLDEPIARALIAADASTISAVYEGALRESCAPQRAALAAAGQDTVRDLIAADLAPRQGPGDATDATLAELAMELGVKELAPALAARLVLPEPGPPDFDDELLAAWARIAGAVDLLDPGAATGARLAALRWSDAPAYTGCEAPGPSWTASYTGYPPSFPLVAAAGLLTRDTPAVRDALAAIGADTGRGGAARQVARFLLATWSDPRADGFQGVSLTPCQTENLPKTP